MSDTSENQTAPKPKPATASKKKNANLPALKTQPAQVPGLSPETSAMLAMIERAARDPSVDVEKMRAMMDLKDHVMDKDAERAWALAMMEAQKEIVPVVKSAENKHTQSKYAKLEKVDAAIRPIYTKHGFSISYGTGVPAKTGNVKVLCFVTHKDGHTKQFELEGELDTSGSQGKANKTGIQGLGSSVSYLRRYLVCMIFNVVMKDEDNDGNASGKPQPTITEAQVMEIDAEVNLYPPEYRTKFLDYMKVEKIPDILARDYKKAKNALAAKADAVRNPNQQPKK